MNIGIDIDDTICKGPDNIVPEALSDDWNERIEYASTIDDAVESLKALIKRCNRIYFISSRYVDDRELTIKWLRKMGIEPYDYTLCLRPLDMYGPDFKRVLISSLGLDVYVDDKPRLIGIAKGVVKHPILFQNWKQVMKEIEGLYERLSDR